MPPASNSSAARTARESRSHSVRPRPRAVTRRLPISKVAWDRKFRILMLGVIGLVGYIGLQAGISLVDARNQEAQESALVQSLSAQHKQLLGQVRALGQRPTIIRDARSLGMVRAGERSYVVVGLGNH